MGEKFIIRQFSEEKELLDYLEMIGIALGSECSVEKIGEYEGPITLNIDGNEVQISYKAACKLLVEKTQLIKQSGRKVYTLKIVLNVEGMACSHCELTVQDAVKKLDGIKKVKAKKRKKEVTVEFDENLTTVENISDSINKTGYEVKGQIA